jgi:ech hydrogenase subunit D
MTEEQKIILVQIGELVAKVKGYSEGGFRLVQINCTQLTDMLEINYSFDKNFSFENLRVVLPVKGGTLPSVSSVYLAACLYENEIHDLYGVNFEGMAIDYKGNFYRTAKKSAFLNTPPPAAAQDKGGAK